MGVREPSPKIHPGAAQTPGGTAPRIRDGGGMVGAEMAESPTTNGNEKWKRKFKLKKKKKERMRTRTKIKIIHKMAKIK